LREQFGRITSPSALLSCGEQQAHRTRRASLLQLSAHQASALQIAGMPETTNVAGEL